MFFSKQKFLCFLVVCIGWMYVFPSWLWAGAAIEAQRQVAQRKAAYQQLLQEKAYQEAYQKAYMQKVAQERAMIERDAYQQQMGQLAYQREIARRQHAARESLGNQRRNPVFHEGDPINQQPRGMSLENHILQSSSPSGSSGRGRVDVDGGRFSEMKNPAVPDEVKNIHDIWDDMMTSSDVWALMMDRAPKEQTVRKYIDFFRQQNVMIRKSPTYYVDLIDQMSEQNPDMLQRPFEDVFRFLAIMEYDFDNGRDPDALAKQVLGDQFYLWNKQRLGR
jgi:hypothetical protein